MARRLNARVRVSERRSGVAHRKFLSTPKGLLICVMGNHFASDSTEAALFEASRICTMTTALKPTRRSGWNCHQHSVLTFQSPRHCCWTSAHQMRVWLSTGIAEMLAAGDGLNNDRAAQTKRAILRSSIKARFRSEDPLLCRRLRAALMRPDNDHFALIAFGASAPGTGRAADK